MDAAIRIHALFVRTNQLVEGFPPLLELPDCCGVELSNGEPGTHALQPPPQINNESMRPVAPILMDESQHLGSVNLSRSEGRRDFVIGSSGEVLSP